MDGLKIYLFGPLRVYRGERCLNKFPTCKTQDLFCYLVLRRQRFHSRNTLAGLFWSDSPEEQARKYLRNTLWRLRSSLDLDGSPEGSYLIIENDEICFNTHSDYWLDVEEFEKRLSTFQSLNAPDIGVGRPDGELLHALTRAVELYQGDLLEGCYADWCLYERERLQGMFLSALAKLMVYHRDQGTYEEAIRCGQCILSYDPLLEEAHRELMRLHCVAGNRAAALRQYRLCQEILVRELGIEPMEETTALYTQICQRESVVGERQALYDTRLASRELEKYTLRSRGSPLLASQMGDALSELRLAQAEVRDLSAHFQRGVEILETIRRELGRTAT